MAQALIGDGLLAHTMTDRSAMRINDVTVLPRTSAGDERPRRPTSTVSTSRASVASSASGSPCLRIVSTASPASLTRSSARCSSSPESEERRPRPCDSFTCATTNLALNRRPRWTACSSASSALGLPSRPTSRRVNTRGWRCSGEHREALQVGKPERERLAGHGKPANQYVVASTRLEALSHHDIFGATTPQRYPPALAHGPLERVERLGRQRTVLRNRRGGTAHFRSPRSRGHPTSARRTAGRESAPGFG